jgi:hypothetical protein
VTAHTIGVVALAIMRAFHFMNRTGGCSCGWLHMHADVVVCEHEQGRHVCLCPCLQDIGETGIGPNTMARCSQCRIPLRIVVLSWRTGLQISVGFVFFGDCFNHAGGSVTVPCTPVKGVHNGCWMASQQDVERTAGIDAFEPYVTTVVNTFKNDRRVRWWEVRTNDWWMRPHACAQRPR